MLNKIVNGDVALWVRFVALVAPPRIGKWHYLLIPSRVIHHRAYVLGKVRLVVELHNLRPVALAVATEEVYPLVDCMESLMCLPPLAERLEVNNVVVLLVWVFENQTNKGRLIVAEYQFVQLHQDINKLNLVCTLINSVCEVSFALPGEADAQVEASCAIVPLLLDRLALTPSEWNHKPSIPLLRSEVSH